MLDVSQHRKSPNHWPAEEELEFIFTCEDTPEDLNEAGIAQTWRTLDHLLS